MTGTVQASYNFFNWGYTLLCSSTVATKQNKPSNMTMMQFDFSAVVDWSDDSSSPFEQYNEQSSLSSRTPSIRFAAEDEVFEIPGVIEEDIHHLWFQPEEFQRMEDELMESVQRIEQQKSNVCENDVLGLEPCTMEGSRRRSQSIRAVCSAVLEEQKRQWRKGQEIPDRIAAVYQIVATKCSQRSRRSH